jgi:general stress protein 26
MDSLDHCDELTELAQRLVGGRPLGVLTTVDADGAPHARWMATLTIENFPRLVTLTSATSAKVRHIRANPCVNWLFSTEDLTIVLNLAGRAQVHTDTVIVKRAWKAIHDKSHPYFLNSLQGRPTIAVIETLIERIECTTPASGICVHYTIGEKALREHPMPIHETFAEPPHEHSANN